MGGRKAEEQEPPLGVPLPGSPWGRHPTKKDIPNNVVTGEEKKTWLWDNQPGPRGVDPALLCAVPFVNHDEARKNPHIRLGFKNFKVRERFTGSEEQRRYGWLERWFKDQKREAFGARRGVVATLIQIENMLASEEARYWFGMASERHYPPTVDKDGNVTHPGGPWFGGNLQIFEREFISFWQEPNAKSKARDRVRDCIQRDGELIRSYLSRFEAAAGYLFIGNPDEALDAFKFGLSKGYRVLMRDFDLESYKTIYDLVVAFDRWEYNSPVQSVKPTKGKVHACYKCGNEGHMARNCKQ